MNFIESMQNRYTTKKYTPTKKIQNTEIQDLKEILHLCPSSINSQPWKFSFISDAEMRNALSAHSWLNTNKVLNCDTLIVFSRIDNIPLFEKRIADELPEGAVAYYNEFIKPQSPDEIKDWFSRQVYLALGVLLSACAEMGIDSTPMEGIVPEQYDRILQHKDYTTLVAVAIGYRAPDDNNQPHLRSKSRTDIANVVDSI